MYVSVCAYVHMHVCLQRTKENIVFLALSLPCYNSMRQGLSLNQKLFILAGLDASQGQGSACLLIPVLEL